MARGTVYKRCQCRDAEGKRVRTCRKDHGAWWFKVEGAPDAQTDRRRQVAKGGFRTRADAEAALTKVQHDMDHGMWVDDRSISVGQWLTAWLEETADRRGAKTMANYRGHVRDVWLPRLGHVRLRDLRRHHVERVLADLATPVTVAADAGNIGRRVTQRSGATIEGYRRTIRAALSAAQRRGLIVLNPAQGRMDSIPESSTPEIQIWEPEETARFLDHVTEDRLAALYELAAYAGLRRAELCGLRWRDLDADGAAIVVRQTIIEAASKDLRPTDRLCTVCGREHTGLLVKLPKSRAGKRWVPLVDPAQRALADRRLAVRTEREACGRGYRDHDLVFSQINGDPLRPSSVTDAFVAHAEVCGLRPIRLHDTRHGACSLLLAAGVPIEVVQMILGHSTPAITRRIYAHVMKRVTAEQVANAAQLIDRYRRGQSADKATAGINPAEGGEAVN
jgi:integrase